MACRVIVEEHESFVEALREFRRLVLDSRISVGNCWRGRRHDHPGYYISAKALHQQRYYFERPGVKRRRKRLSRQRVRRFWESRLAFHKASAVHLIDGRCLYPLGIVIE